MVGGALTVMTDALDLGRGGADCYDRRASLWAHVLTVINRRARLGPRVRGAECYDRRARFGAQGGDDCYNRRASLGARVGVC